MDGPLVARLNSLSSSLDDLNMRLAELVEERRSPTEGEEDIVGGLEEVERQVRNASRRLRRLVRDLERRK